MSTRSSLCEPDVINTRCPCLRCLPSACCLRASQLQYVGNIFGRTSAWEVWGPSGEDDATGTAAVIDGLRKVRRVVALCFITFKFTIDCRPIACWKANCYSCT